MNKAEMFATAISKLRSMANSPYKKQLLEDTEPAIKRLLSPETYGGDVKEMPKHVWLHGSFNYKDDPKDIDIAAKFPYLWGEAKALKARAPEGGPSYDPYFFTKHDLNEGLPDRSMIKEAVQEGRKRYGKDYKWTKLAGAAGLGLVVGDMLSPKDADAMPLGKVIKGTYKTFQQAMRSKTPLGAEMKKAGQLVPAQSSSNKRLVGMPLQGSKISGVYQGAGDSRYIHLEDGRVFPTDKASLNELAAERGTSDYIKQFEEKSKEAQWEQILKSYKMNQQRGTPSRTSGGRKPNRIRILEDSLTDRQGMIGNDSKLADQVLVQDNKTKMWWLWPRVYAEPAEAAGLVRIDKAKNTLFTNKGL